MEMTTNPAGAGRGGVAAAVLLGLLLSSGPLLAGDGFKIKEAKWDQEKQRLTVKGKGKKERTVTLMYASNHEVIATQTIDDDEWKFKERGLSPVPCRVRVVQSDGRSAEKKVKHAPDDCDLAGDPNPPPPPPAGGNGNYTVLAANDLGMHCADTDYRLFSILPPYNVLNAQVLRKGQEPQLLGPADGISVTYEATTSNVIDPNDPTLPPLVSDSITTTSQNDLAGGIFKSNFWEIIPPESRPVGVLAYDSLYPAGVLDMFGLPPDTGLPAPNLVELYLGGGTLQAEQSAMPGPGNTPQPFHGYVADLPFFINFPFGYTVQNFNRYTAEGVPITPTDDMGLTNPYPLMRVVARDSDGNELAAVETVVPVASEADCQICHASQNVCDFDTTNTLVCDDIANSKPEYNSVQFIEDASLALGDTPEQKVINAAKTNIMRLHDFKFGTSLVGPNPDGSFADGSTPNVVCANCHYSPALDLAHMGPTDDNGKEQTRHISMSRAMHGYHGALNQDADYSHLFPLMPLPDERTAQQQEEVLQETCYNCHPGKRTKCLRGAMSDAGIVCQDCHGQLTQVGDDFSENFPLAGFPDGADLSKRVPWASEPKCQSCHLGDVLQVKQLASSGMLTDAVLNVTDKAGNPDNLRLKLAYARSDHKSVGGPDKLALWNFSESRFASNQDLYRLSGGKDNLGKGHEGLSCENCHGSTHAIWPNANPWSNDNRTAEGLQGHTGAIVECSTCHEGDLGITLDGPHGMHPVGATKFAEDHEKLAEKNANACRSCHGENGEGTVLSRTAAERSLKSDEKQPDGSKTIVLAKGERVTCSSCHENKL